MTTEKILGPKGLNITQEAEKPAKISRRDFLRGGTAVLGVVGASALGLHLIERSSTAHAGEKGDFTETEEILAFIRERYGVEIPSEVSDEYSERIYHINLQGEKELLEVKQNAILRQEEAEKVAETLEEVPAVGDLIQLVIPYRYKEQGPIAKGSYLGSQWQALLHATIFDERSVWGDQTFVHAVDYVLLPPNFSVSDKTAIRLVVPEGVAMKDPLPPIEESYIFVLPPFLQMALKSAGIKAARGIEIPWSTHGERVRQALVHETGQSLLDKVSLADSKDVNEYRARQEPSIFGKNTFDVDNPLLKAFAQVNGWKKVSYADFIYQYFSSATDIFLGELSEDRERLVWGRDVSVWRDLRNRKIRVSPLASYGTIQEAFSEYWMASILYPELLTPEERGFFQRIHEGLRKNPGAFIKKVASD